MSGVIRRVRFAGRSTHPASGNLGFDMAKNPGVRRLDSAESSDGPWSPARAAVPGYAPEPGQIDELVVELAPRKSALNTMMWMVEAFGAEHSVSEVAIFRVNLELDELVTNYLVHRRPADWPARMAIRIRLFARRLVLVVAGTAMTPRHLHHPWPVSLSAEPAPRARPCSCRPAWIESLRRRCWSVLRFLMEPQRRCTRSPSFQGFLDGL